jgi:hypothetical protein
MAPTEPPFAIATGLPSRLTTPGADPGVQWTGVKFAKAAGYTDPEIGLGSMVTQTLYRWKGGWMMSAEGLAAGSDTPSFIFLSSDGETWEALPAPGSCVPTADGLVSLNAAGDAWTSTDGRNWSSRVTSGPTGFVIVAGTGGLLATLPDGGVAYSRDAIAWERVSLPTVGGVGIFPQAVAWTGSRFVMTGISGAAEEAVALWSPDGRTWQLAHTPVPPREATFAVARDGLLVANTWFEPRVWLWSADGVEWQDVSGDQPVWTRSSKTWVDLLSNGERMIARAADGRMWTSFDGRAWTRLAGSAPLSTGSDNVRGMLSLMPRGIFYDDWKHSYVAYGAAA